MEMNRRLMTGLAALTIAASLGIGCVDSQGSTYARTLKQNIRKGEFSGSVDAPPVETKVFNKKAGYFRFFPCNEAVDLNGNGQIEESEFLGSKKSFYVSEQITFVLSATALYKHGVSKGLRFELVNPRGELVTSENFEAPLEGRTFTYVLNENEKVPGEYTVNITKGKKDLFEDLGQRADSFKKVFEIIPQPERSD